MPKWGFLTNHALVLIHVLDHRNSTLREIAQAVGITERATLSILRAMEEEGIVSRRKEGRRNRYRVDVAALLEHQAKSPYNVAEIASNLMAMAEHLQAARS